MASGQLRSAINQLRCLMGRPEASALKDAQLLENFVKKRDEASFEVLVWRHAAMVLSLCQRILRDSHAAEDAFQATFLVFARKAGSIGKRDAIGSWLYKVAYRIALRARTSSTNGNHILGSPTVDELPAPAASDDVVWRDLRPVLDEEIDRLPEKYRVPFILCYLEGQTNEEAAEQLGCPKGTVLSRLARGRQRLQSRLVRRGVVLTAAAVTAALAQHASAGSAPAGLVSSTIQAAIPFSAGQSVAGLIPVSAAALTQGVLRTSFLTKLKIATAALVALAALGTGAGWITHSVLADDSRPRTQDHESASRGPGDKGRGSDRRPDTGEKTTREAAAPPDVSGKVTDVAKDGKSFAILVPATTRGDEPSKAQVTLGDKTLVTYFGVGPDGAAPSADYSAEVKFAEKGKDLATGVVFRGAVAGYGRGGRNDISGRVIAVARGGKGLTLELPRDRSRPRDEEAPRAEYKFDDKTQLIFSGIARGGANLAEGLEARIQLDDPKGNVPLVVFLQGTQQAPDRSRPEADIAGKVLAVGKDEKSITVEMFPAAPKERGSAPAESKQLEIKLSDSAELAFFNVGRNGTTITAGFLVRIWLVPGSKDTAAKASFTGTVKERGTVLSGKVIGVGKDGRSVTVELAPTRSRERGEEPKEPTKTEIIISDRTRVSYYGVGPGEARPAEGLAVQVRLDEAGKEAWDITFTKEVARARKQDERPGRLER